MYHTDFIKFTPPIYSLHTGPPPEPGEEAGQEILIEGKATGADTTGTKIDTMIEDESHHADRRVDRERRPEAIETSTMTEDGTEVDPEKVTDGDMRMSEVLGGIEIVPGRRTVRTDEIEAENIVGNEVRSLDTDLAESEKPNYLDVRRPSGKKMRIIYRWTAI